MEVQQKNEKSNLHPTEPLNISLIPYIAFLAPFANILAMLIVFIWVSDE